ncbi:hypothetical protein [Actinomyces sp. MRS3W]|uniref:hypothetical protein n=1 Tax=Actinomyces sp. MRS3W TaxID=2800796 RepID=UPI0028FD6EBD|nr:hypothetical protein [Actinomyces sp. MRS3W]MDU0348097.1 hypothetical protein [Actinomyces sp. MRS3W]
MPAVLAQVWPQIPGRSLLTRLLPNDPTGASLLVAGILLITIGWGAHLARRSGRLHELADLRSQQTPTPPQGLARPHR